MRMEEFEEIARAFKDWRDERGRGIAELAFFSWWREPDYLNDYRALWRLEQALSSPGRAQRFELLSTWRLARDEAYATWAASLGPAACQISFFGLEETTDWGMRRRFAFRDQLAATERCLEAGIAPRWQLFLTKRALPELEGFLHLMLDLDLRGRCEKIGRTFEFFIGGISPEGCGYELEGERLERADLQRIPRELVLLSRDGLDLLGQPECELLPALLAEERPPNVRANFPCLAIDAEYDVYPNDAEPAAWWRLGNLKADGLAAIMDAYRGQTTPGMIANRTIPLSGLARRYGDPASRKLYERGDLVCRFLHQWGVENG